MVILIVTEEQGWHMVGIVLDATKCPIKHRIVTQRRILSQKPVMSILRNSGNTLLRTRLTSGRIFSSCHIGTHYCDGWGQ